MAFKFYEDYFNYIGLTESPTIYHRWSAVSMVAALLGRNIRFPFGHGYIYPNMYVMLVGNPGARKGTALKPAKNALKLIEYDRIAPDRISPERFLIEMAQLNADVDIEGMEFETLTPTTPSEIYVLAEEFGDFIKTGNIDFINLLTNLWDNLDFYKHPKIHGRSVYIHEPTVNLIGATTQQGMALSLPIEAIGQGFLSRFVLVHGEPTGTKITFPPPVDDERRQKVQGLLEEIKQKVHGTLEIGDDARILLDRIYKTFTELDDFRFKHYNTRRFTHLLKLCIVFAAMDASNVVESTHVLQANTLLFATEARMPKALGEFGKSKHADVANTIIELLKTTAKPLATRDIWKRVAQDLNRIDDLVDILRGLEAAERIQQKEIGGKKGFMPVFKMQNRWSEDLLIQKEFLTPEERV